MSSLMCQRHVRHCEQGPADREDFLSIARPAGIWFSGLPDRARCASYQQQGYLSSQALLCAGRQWPVSQHPLYELPGLRLRYQPGILQAQRALLATLRKLDSRGHHDESQTFWTAVAGTCRVRAQIAHAEPQGEHQRCCPMSPEMQRRRISSFPLVLQATRAPSVTVVQLQLMEQLCLQHVQPL